MQTILLSFAPSAAAGWHGERQRIPYARNGVRHSVFFALGSVADSWVLASHVFSIVCLWFSRPKQWKNKAERWPFFADFWLAVDFFHRFLVSFSLLRAPLEPPGLPFFPGGAPGQFFNDF